MLIESGIYIYQSNFDTYITAGNTWRAALPHGEMEIKTL